MNIRNRVPYIATLITLAVSTASVQGCTRPPAGSEEETGTTGSPVSCDPLDKDEMAVCIADRCGGCHAPTVNGSGNAQPGFVPNFAKYIDEDTEQIVPFGGQELIDELRSNPGSYCFPPYPVFNGGNPEYSSMYLRMEGVLPCEPGVQHPYDDTETETVYDPAFAWSVKNWISRECDVGETWCGLDTGCVDFSSDDSHCGDCGDYCPSGGSCIDSVCSCDPGKDPCTIDGFDLCIDLTWSEEHCGACDNACSSGKMCFNGSCQCPEGTAECTPGACTPLNTGENCASCGDACGPGLVCSNGACASDCPPGQDECNGGCADLGSDELNCGTCEFECEIGLSCSNGQCCNYECGAGEACFNGSCCEAIEVGFSEVEQVFSDNCTGNTFCHAQSEGHLLKLDGPGLWENLVNAEHPHVSECLDQPFYVTPWSTSGSFLYRKLLVDDDYCGGGFRMPLEGSITTDELFTVRDWVCQGAGPLG